MTRGELKTAWEKTIEALCTGASEKAESVIKAQLDAWARRWPRHTFKAWDSMGVFAIQVFPPVMGDTFPDHLSPDERGAIGELVREVESLTDWYNGLDQRLTLGIHELTSD